MTPSGFERALPLSTIEGGALGTATVKDWPIAVALQDGVPHAVLNRCSHGASVLSGSRIRRGILTCPLHGGRFELATGRCVGGAYAPIRTFPARISEDWIEVCVPDTPPAIHELPASV